MDITQLKHEADIYLNQGDFTAAINIYEKCIELVPNLISNYWYLGLAWLLQGNEIESQSIWLSTLTNSDLDLQDHDLIELIDLLKNKADEYLKHHNHQLAQPIYEAILEWDNNQPEVYYNLGYAMAMQGNLDAAIDYWQTTIEIQPDFVDAYLNQAYIWQKLENFTEAIDCYENILKITNNYLIYYQLGLCYSCIKKWESAINCFYKSIKLKNDYAPAYSDLGLSLIYSGELETGINFLRKSLQIQPQFSEYLVNIGKCETLKLNNIHLTVINIIKSLLNFSESGDKLYLNLGKVFSTTHPEIAIQLLQTATQLEPENIEAVLELSKILLNQNQVDEAIGILNDVNIENNEELSYLKSQCYLKSEDYQQAIFYSQEAIKINPALIESYYLLGIAFLRVGNIEAAITSFKQHLAVKPDSPLTLAHLGFICGKKHQIEDTINYFQQAISINSSMITFIDKFMNALILEDNSLNRLDFSPILPISPPDKFYKSTQDWIENDDVHKSNYVEIYPEIDIKLNYPKSLDNSIHFSFRFGSNLRLPSSFAITIPQGRFWLSADQTQSAIIINESHFLADISPNFPILSPNHPDKDPRNHAIFSIENLPPIQFIEGNVAVLAGLTNNIYFHWMLDILPRWELLRKQNCNFDKVDYFVVDNSLPFQRETLNLLQIPESKQININRTHHIQASKLIVPSFPASVAWMPKWTCEFLNYHFLMPEYVKNTNSKQRIYITRNLAKSRRILNEDEILNLLKSHGFTVVVLESMSVLEQAALFSQAKIIISPHGSGLTNLVFCQPGTKVIELFAPNYVYHCYWWISNLIGLDYYYLLGETLPGWHFHHLIYPQDFSEDIVINVKDLFTLLQIADIT